MDQISLLILGGVGICVVMVAISLTTVRKETSRQTTNEDQLTSTANFIWSSMIPSQQDELNKIPALQDQESWVEEHFSLEERSSLSGEKILLALANRGLIKLGMGTFKRYAPAIDYSSTSAPTELTVEEEGNEVSEEVLEAPEEVIVGDEEDLITIEPENHDEVTESASQIENNADNSCQSDDKSV